MLNPNQLRPLISALYALVLAVVVMLSLVVTLAWVMPKGSSAATAATGAVAASAGASAAPVAKTISADATAGKGIFENNCAACHSTGADKLVGPGLKGVRKRAPGEDWLKKWIHNPAAMVSSGDAYAVKIFNENGQVQMTSFPNLTDQQIKQILDYVDASN